MAYFKISKDTMTAIHIAVTVVSPVVAALATAQWGGHIVRSLAQAGLLRTGILAAVQSVAGIILGSLIDESIIKNFLFSNKHYHFYVSLIVGSLVSGGTVYAVAALAVKAGLISTGLTLPAAAALVIVPAVVEGASLLASAVIEESAKRLDLIEVR